MPNSIHQPQVPSVPFVYQDASKREKRDQLITDHLDYVAHIANRLARRLPDWVDGENLQSAGVVGLIEAAQSFDESRGVVFKTYSYPRIRGAMIDEIRRNSPLSQKVIANVTRLRAAMENLEPPIMPEALSEATGLTLQEVEEGLAASRLLTPQTWDELGYVAPDQETPVSIAEQEEKTRILADAIESLPQRDRAIVQMYHMEEMKLKEIGMVLNLSESRVSRILDRAEKRLRDAVERAES